jgi:predicted exporter
VRTISDVLPTKQPEKLEQVAGIREALTPKIRSLLEPAVRDKLDRLLGDEAQRPIGLDDLPGAALVGLRERDGQAGRALLLYPRAMGEKRVLWQADAIHRFVAALREVASAASPPARVAGSIPISGDILTSIAHDAPRASAISLFGVVLVVIVVLRGRRTAAYVIGALLVGVIWLGGGSMLLGVKINFANFIAYPITFGIGVDYAVNVMTRYAEDGRGDVRGAIAATGGAVALCSLTTILGYSSLLLAKNRALYLFGLMAVMGEVACLVAAVLVLPAVLFLLARVAGSTATTPSTDGAA